MKRIFLVLLIIISTFAHAQVGHFNQDNRKVQVKVVSGFTQNDRYSTADGTGPRFNTTNFTVWLVTQPPRNQTTNNQQIPFGKTSMMPGTAYADWQINLFQGCFNFIVDSKNYDVAYTLTQIYSQGSNISWDEIDKIDVFHFVILNGVQRTYKNGVLYGQEGLNPAGLAKSSIVKGAAIYGVGIGAAGGTQTSNVPYEGGIITAGISTSTGLTDAQVKAHYQAINSNPYVGFTGATHLWKAEDAGATWVDSISGLSATRIGNPTITDTQLSFYPPYDVTAFYGDTTPQWAPLTGNIKILRIGDSRTFGEGSYFLWTMRHLSIPSVTFQLVGGAASYSGFGYVDKNDGLPGRSTPGTVSGVPAGLPSYANELINWDPDVVIMWYGQNAADTQVGQADERNSFETILQQTYAYDPNIRILVLSEISGIRQSGISGGQQATKFWSYDLWKERKVSEYRNKGYKISYCKITMTLPYDSPSSDYDGDFVHPAKPPYATPDDMLGHNKIGVVVMPAFSRLIGYQY